jgi:bifunctional UDP-N-acetylglucosamine pyrophosphorylase/glucosamine-1-phosphate N-acetyltransferase
MSKQTTAIVLAAGMGVRMKSPLPKVLHAAAGRAMIDHVISSLNGAGVNQVRLVVGHGAEKVQKYLEGSTGVGFFNQLQQLGTANAVLSADVDSLEGRILICNGDHPLISADDYADILAAFEKSKCDLLVLSANIKNPSGFGRIIHINKNEFEIIEEKEATREQKKVCEVNSGLYVVKAELLKKLLPLIKNENSKKEFYLTDLIKLAFRNGKRVIVHRSNFTRVCRGVNNQLELALASKALYLRKARELLDQGVTIIDPSNTYIESSVIVGAETVIHPGSFISGSTNIGKACVIEPYCQISDSEISDSVRVRWGSLIEQSKVGVAAIIGPYARLRPDSIVGSEAHVGNFVELKKTTLGARSKANHLSYLGDAEIGEDTNIGCGTITCNYAIDRKKYKTKIGSRVFVGSDTQFVAPVTIGDGSAIASGSTITQDVPEDSLALARIPQVIKPGYMKKKDD